MPKYQTKAFTNVKPLVLPYNASANVVAVDVEFPTAALINGDFIEICTLPAGVKCLDWKIVFPDVDGADTIRASLGVMNALGTDLGAEVWQTGINCGGTNAIVSNTTSLSAQGVTKTDRNIALKLTAGPTGYTGAGKIGQIHLTLQA